MNAQRRLVNLVPGMSAPAVLHASEGDVGRVLEIVIIDGQLVYNIPSTATVTITATKPSGMGFTQACTVTENGTATFETTASMTDESGKMQAEVRIVDGGKNIGTANLLWVVERNPHPSSVIDGDVERAKTILERAEEAMAKAEQMIEEVEVYNSIVEEVENIRVDVDGKVYDSAGDAVRGQVSGLKEDLKSSLNAVEKYTNETIPLYWEQGSIDLNTGSDITSTSKIRTQRIDLTNYSHVTFNNTTGYKFRTAWLASDGSVVKEAAYNVYRTVTSVSYGYMERYGISAVRIVLSKSDDTSDITPASGSVFSVVGVPKIKTQITAIDQIIHKGYDNKSTEWDEYPLSVEDFSVGSLNVSTGAVATGYRPITDFITFDNDMMISIETTYKVDVFVYQQDGTFVKHTGWDYIHYIPYADDRKYKFMFDLANIPNNSTSPQIDTLLHSNVFIGVKKKKQYIRDSVDDVVDNMEGQNGNCLNIAFITDLHVTAFEAISLKTINVWRRTTNGLAKVDKLRNIDFVVLGGDYLWNNASHTSLKMAEDAYDLLQEVFYQFKDKEFALKGNHDDNSITNDVSKLITDSMRYGYLGQQYTNQVEVKYGDIEKSYGYIDFKRQKVRAIFINTVDIPYDDNLTYKGQHITGVGNDQLNFIANALNFNEAGWSVIFFSHHLLINNATMNPSSDAEAYLLSTHGGDALWGIILAYKGKTTYSKVSTLTDFNYSVSVDYTSNHSDSVLACICGHTHRDLSATQDGILMISTTASGYGRTAYDSTGTKITYTEGTQTETAFDIFSFDRVNGTIKASRYGAGQNRTWS